MLALVIFGAVLDAHAQPAAPAEAHAEPADTKPVSYSWKDGETTFAFGHGEAVLSNRLQLRWRDRRPAGREGARLFNIPRGRTELTGWLGSEHLTYEVQVDWAEGPGLEDLFLSWDASRNGTLNIQAGQFKVPLGRQRLTSSGSQQFVDRADVVDEFTAGRDIGVQVHGVLASDRVEYRAGVFNGAGQNTWSHDGGLQYAGRVMVQPFGEVEYSESDLEFAEAPLLAVAANIETSDGRDDAEGGRRVVVGADVDLRYQGLSLLSEVFFRTLRDAADGTGSNGLVVQGGYLVIARRLEVAGRFGTWSPADAAASPRHREIGLAVSYFVNAHNFKVQSDVRRLTKAADAPADHVVRVHLQVVF